MKIFPRYRRLILVFILFFVVNLLSIAHAQPLLATRVLAPQAGVVGGGTPASCTEAALDAALLGGGLITFNCGAAAHMITLSGTKIINNSVVVDGGGLITLSGALAVTIFRVLPGATLDVANLTLSDGRASGGSGGGIENSGTLRVRDSRFLSNTATIDGGAIASSGVVTVSNSTFDNNSAGFLGGGIANSGALTITNSTVNNNRASSDGGAIANRTITSTLNITGSVMAGNSANRAGGGIANAGTLTITDSTISDNRADFSGGGIFNNGSAATVAVISGTIVSNKGDERGGGVYNVEGTVMLTNSTVSLNRAPAVSGIGGHGGGIYNGGGKITLIESTMSGNSAIFNGGGIHSDSGLIELTKSTVSGNSAQRDGAGIHSSGGQVKLTNSTVSGNNALQNGGGLYSNSETTVDLIHVTLSHNRATLGGGIANISGIVILTNTLVGDNLLGSDCNGAITSHGYNLASDNSCGLVLALGDLPATPTGLDPLLHLNAPGTTETHALLAGSLAVDHIPTGMNGCGVTSATDQRGAPRSGAGTTGCDIGAYELQLSHQLYLPIIRAPSAPPLAFAVNSLFDEPDDTPGDTFCISTPSAVCTLRAAIMETNAVPGPDTITLLDETYTLTITGTNEEAAATGDLDITDPLTIIGVSGGNTVVDGGGIDRIFHIAPTGATVTVSISDVTLQNGNTSGDGGGILNQSVTTLTRMKVLTNAAFDCGGGIANRNGAVLLITGSMVDQNTSVAGVGGGLCNVGATAQVNQSTISHNQAHDRGGGIVNSSDGGVTGDLTLRNVTVSGNMATTHPSSISNGELSQANVAVLTMNNVTVSDNSGGISTGLFAGTVVQLSNTIIANNGLFTDCANGPFTSKGYNLDSDGSCSLTATSDLSAMNPNLGPLQNNGGSTQTQALQSPSPAIDRGNSALPNAIIPACESTDQRGVARPQGAHCDMGAYESP